MLSGKKIRIGLRLKFAIGAVVFVTFIVFSFSAFFISTYRQLLEQKLEEKGLALTKTIAENSQSEYFLWIKNEEKLRGLLRGVVGSQAEASSSSPGEDDDVIFGAFFDEGKKPVARRDIGRFTMPPEKITSFLYPSGTRTGIISEKGRRFMVVAMPVTYVKEFSSNEDVMFEDVMPAGEHAERSTIGYAVTVLSFRKIEDSLLNVKRYVVVFLSIIAAVSMLMISFMVGLTLAPLNRLLLGLQHITKGNYSVRVSVRRSDELGDLGEAFNFMTSVIEKSNKELEAYSRELEHKVRQRTKEIEDMQLQLIQAGKLAAVGELSAGIAHELNNPIGGILGYSQFIVEKIKKDPEGVKNNISSIERYLSLIARESQRCKRIIRNLLRFSRASKMEFEPTDINIVLKESVDIISSQLESRDIRFESSYAKNLLLTQANANQLQQVFANILINAQKAVMGKKDAFIKVSSARRKGKNSEEDVIEICFSDNGCGIAKENLSKIFDPFFTTRKTGEGTGLGLSLSYGIVKDHGGDILVESEEKKGTVFTVLLPVKK